MSEYIEPLEQISKKRLALSILRPPPEQLPTSGEQPLAHLLSNYRPFSIVKQELEALGDVLPPIGPVKHQSLVQKMGIGGSTRPVALRAPRLPGPAASAAAGVGMAALASAKSAEARLQAFRTAKEAREGELVRCGGFFVLCFNFNRCMRGRRQSRPAACM